MGYHTENANWSGAMILASCKENCEFKHVNPEKSDLVDGDTLEWVRYSYIFTFHL